MLESSGSLSCIVKLFGKAQMRSDVQRDLGGGGRSFLVDDLCLMLTCAECVELLACVVATIGISTA